MCGSTQASRTVVCAARGLVFFTVGLKVPCELLINRFGYIRFAHVHERVSTKSCIVLIEGNSRLTRPGTRLILQRTNDHYEQALVCLSNREIVFASRGRRCIAKWRITVYNRFFSNWFGLIYLAN